MASSQHPQTEPTFTHLVGEWLPLQSQDSTHTATESQNLWTSSGRGGKNQKQSKNKTKIKVITLTEWRDQWLCRHQHINTPAAKHPQTEPTFNHLVGEWLPSQSQDILILPQKAKTFHSLGAV